MPLSLTTRRKQQTLLSGKWSTQQHLAQHQNTDINATAVALNVNLFRHHQHHSSNYLNQQQQPVRRQKSLIESLNLNKTLLTAHTRRAYLSRGLSVGRPPNIQRSSYSKDVLKKHSSPTAQSCNGRNDREFFKTGNAIKSNIKKSSEQSSDCGSDEFRRNNSRIQAWSSANSILKSLDKELAQLNGVVVNFPCKDVNIIKDRDAAVDNEKLNRQKADSATKSGAQSSHPNQKQIKTEIINKVNLSIVLTHPLDSTKEEHDCLFSDQEVDDDEVEDTLSNSEKIINSFPKSKDNKNIENIQNSLNTNSSSRLTVPAQQRRALYHATSLATNLALTSNNNKNNNNPTLKSGIQISQNFNASPSLTVQKRPPLIRAMSAPVRSFDERTTKGSATFFNSKRKPRRRKLTTRNLSCDKESSGDILAAQDFNFNSNSKLNRKVLARSKSVATDVVTLVSLISSEGSDSEKEDSSLTANNSHTGSPNRRAPSLRKTGKSVSFQENYPPTFQFASKEYSHMLRRGSIAPLAQRIHLNRPPTAPAASVYHVTQKTSNQIPATNTKSNDMENKSNLENSKHSSSNTLSEIILNDKPLEEEYKFPEYVRSLKERECWKLFVKMSAKGVNITYDTILRGMLTPTEFRQLQKQRETEEAKALKDAADKVLVEETAKRSPTAIERLKENLLKN